MYFLSNNIYGLEQHDYISWKNVHKRFWLSNKNQDLKKIRKH